MKKKKQTKMELPFLFLGLACVCLVMIFCFSSQTFSQSNTLSGYLANSICRLLEKGHFRVPDSQNINLIIRKCAHFTEYFLLGLCLSCFSFFRREHFLKKGILCVTLLSFLFACSDEIHQIFVSARTASFWDVLLDTGGAFFAALLLNLLLKRRKRTKS
ncbi:MAG: VanZ family protein [Oscillospiraceae bacterium]|jgi:VanZ family protein|nr:VanZ family protein [Oscillospiraceae bacterium]